MFQSIHLTLPPEVAFDERAFEETILNKIGAEDLGNITIRRKKQSIDARSKQVKVNIEVAVYANEAAPDVISYDKNYTDVSQKKTIIIVGAGPAGIFAALRAIELGFKPIVIERGKDVRSRRRDLAAINKDHIVNPESNYCFGEGGAGTYSDGKLYTRSNKRGDVRKVLEMLVAHGATEQILYEAHPHIGTNKLPALVAELRQSILGAGGEVHFNTKVSDFVIQNNEIKGVVTTDAQEFRGLGVVLATGHSARDIFELCVSKNILVENKPFALGVRIEHPQRFIDSVQYHSPDRGPYLPAASYSLVAQTHLKGVQRGVFSFCMCPGGFIVPSATAPGELVVNGMSPSRRDSRFANSGMVVSVNEVDWRKYQKFGPLAALEMQKIIEQRACAVVGGDQTAPAQLVGDFINKKVSKTLLDTSYQPGLKSLDLQEYLPECIAEPLREGLQMFGQKIKNYSSNEAQLIGVESRTSSPVRIPRDRDTAEHLQTQRLYPCGEGAGYAGGIMSAALDGMFVIEQMVKKYGYFS